MTRSKVIIEILERDGAEPIFYGLEMECPTDNDSSVNVMMGHWMAAKITEGLYRSMPPHFAPRLRAPRQGERLITRQEAKEVMDRLMAKQQAEPPDTYLEKNPGE